MESVKQNDDVYLVYVQKTPEDDHYVVGVFMNRGDAEQRAQRSREIGGFAFAWVRTETVL